MTKEKRKPEKNTTMNSNTRFYVLIASTTVLIMFVILKFAVPTVEQKLSNFIAAPIISILVTAGVYRLLFLGIRLLMEKWSWIKKLILGREFVHGTWTGTYYESGKNGTSAKGEKFFFVEHILQTLESIQITGQSYDKDRQPVAHWYSEMADYDPVRGVFICSYELRIEGEIRDRRGYNRSIVTREGQDKAPTAYIGYSHDLLDEERYTLRAEKDEDRIIDFESALTNRLDRDQTTHD